ACALAPRRVFLLWREQPWTVNRLPTQPDGESHSSDRTDFARTSPRSPDASGEAARRQRMVELQLRGRDITDERTLRAMMRAPRHVFVPAPIRDQSYDDPALPIPHGQTISQPYIVALMTQLAQVRPDSRVLDVGTGSGYQAAVLAEIADHVCSIEILCELADDARER